MTDPPPVPVTREQAILMIEAADDLDSLTPEQQQAIRVLFRLDDPRSLAEIHRDPPPCACSSDPGHVCTCAGGCEAGTQDARPGEEAI